MEDKLNPAVFWLFGKSGAGKTTIATEAVKLLRQHGFSNVVHLDGDELRKGLCSGLTMSKEDRTENLRRAAEVAKMMITMAGQVCICSFITPYATNREMVERIVGEDDSFFIYIDCNEKILEIRDTKCLYKNKADMPFEEPQPTEIDIRICTDTRQIASCTSDLTRFILDECL